jgi:2',3'-cyclic-nucleotide 2'-phosphodiesterase (5'-nucleotidase family)
MTYEALRRIGYDGVTIGNHEHFDAGYDNIHGFEAALGRPLLCLNLLNHDGSTAFERSRIVVVNGLKVGLIGLIVPRKKNCLDANASGLALAAESSRLREQGADLVIALCHVNSRQCANWSRAAPDVNVFVSGHSHEVLATPVVVPETGAFIVQAGEDAQWVGRLDLEFDPATREILHAEGRLVSMRHDQIPADAAMLAWVREREQALAPEAAEFVFNNPAELDGYSIARIAAEGLRRAAQADVGFCHPAQIIREVLPAGAVDVNALFKTGGHRGAESVLVELTGAEIEAYITALQNILHEPPEWAGFRVSRVASPNGGDIYRSDLDPSRRYRVVMAKLEWETRFLRLAAKMRVVDPHNALGARNIAVAPTPVSFTDALLASIKQILAEGVSLQDRALAMAQKRELQP